MTNPAQAPRHPVCGVCRNVKVPADVTIRLFDENLGHLPLAPVLRYLRDIGYAGQTGNLKASLTFHRGHVSEWLAKGAPIIPALRAEGIQRIEPPIHTAWVDENQATIDVGMAAIGKIGRELDEYGPTDVISVARLGHTAAATRAQLEMKGAIARERARADIASGFEPPPE